MNTFPPAFAVLRTLSYRGSYWQIIEVNSHTYNEINHIYYDFNFEGRFRDTRQVDEVIILDRLPIYPKTATFRLDDDDIRELSYYTLPIKLRIFDETIPVLNFDLKSWLPRPEFRIPVERVDDVYNVFHRSLQDYRVARRATQTPSQQRPAVIRQLDFRPPTPPRPGHQSPASVRSDDSELSVYVSPQRMMEFPTLPSSRSSSPPVSHPLPIPELVGHLLIENAIRGEDSCPITAVPYREIQRISATSCFHVFETEAIQTWLREHSQCPVCRNSINNMITKEIKN
jgi:hypothetical protein